MSLRFPPGGLALPAPQPTEVRAPVARDQPRPRGQGLLGGRAPMGPRPCPEAPPLLGSVDISAIFTTPEQSGGKQRDELSS